MFLFSLKIALSSDKSPCNSLWIDYDDCVALATAGKLFGAIKSNPADGGGSI